MVSTRNCTSRLQNDRVQKTAFDFSYLPVRHVYQKRLGAELMLPAGPLSQKLSLTSFHSLFFHCYEKIGNLLCISQSTWHL